MIVLDTQPVSQLQRVGSKDADRIEERLQGIPVDQVRTVITDENAFGKINFLPQTIASETEILHFHYGASSSGFWITTVAVGAGRILPFDWIGHQEFRKFRSELIRRIGRCDAQIAAIALAHGATLMTSNKRDFQQVIGSVRRGLAQMKQGTVMVSADSPPESQLQLLSYSSDSRPSSLRSSG